MKQYLTELRWRYEGARWVGPVIQAHSLRHARRMMEHSPYLVVGQLVEQPQENGDAQVAIEEPGEPCSKTVH